MVKVTAAESVKLIEKYIECCLIKGSCFGCPFYKDGKDYLSGRCMGAKEYGGLLMGMMDDIRKELRMKREK